MPRGMVDEVERELQCISIEEDYKLTDCASGRLPERMD